MAFSLNWDGSNVVATVTGGTQASPNLASALADAFVANGSSDINTRGFRSGNIMWLDSLKLAVEAGAWFKWDDDSTVELRTDFRSYPKSESSPNANDGGSVIFGYRSVIKLLTSVRRFDGDCFMVSTGGTAIFLKDVTGINPLITKNNTNRNDFPTLNPALRPASIQMEGLTYIVVAGITSSQKWYFGTSRNIGSLDLSENLNLSGGGEIFQAYNTTYENASIPTFAIAGEVSDSVVVLNNASFGTDGVSSAAFTGTWRKGQYFINSPKFPINSWNGDLNAGFSAGSVTGFCVRFNQKITFSDGTNGIEGVLVRIDTIVRSAGSGYDLSLLATHPQAAAINFTTTADGIYQVDLIDTLKARNNAGQGDSNGITESYQYNAQGRIYEYDSPRYIFQNRNYGVGGLLGDDVATTIMILDLEATLTESEASALTLINSKEDFYCRAKHEWVNNDNFENEKYVRLSGNEAILGAFNVNIDATASSAFSFAGTTITIKSSTYTGDMVTTGVITLLNGATFNGTRTDANGTISPPVTYSLQLPNIIDGSRFQIYNVTTGSELNNATVSGGTGISASYTKGTEYTAGDVGRYRVSYQSGVNAKEPIEGSFTFTTASTVNSLPTTQVAFTNYTTFGVDGSAISEFSWDSGNIEVDINDADNSTSVQRFAAWYYYFITTSVGINEGFGAILWESLNSIRINAAVVGVKIDNTKTIPLLLTGGRIYGTDGATIIASLSGSIQVDYDPVYTVETSVSGLTPAESAKLTAIETATNDIRDFRGLTLGKPATFTPTGISTSTKSVTITGDGKTTSTVTRNA